MRVALAVAAAILTGCTPTPDSYPIPPQHEPVQLSARPPAATEYSRASDPASARYIVKEVQDIESNFRWTRVEPEFRFFLNSRTNRRFRMEFGVNEPTFRDTGPVTLVYFVNGHELGRETYDSVGPKVFEKPVPQEWLKVGEENRVVVRVLNPWQASDPGVLLGVTLHGAGFVQ